MNRSEAAATFRRLHAKPPLILPNAWDAATARVIEDAGASAIATTSAGVSWTFGRSDGERLGRDEAVAAIRRIADAVGVPVTADIEGGYGDGTPADVAATVRAVIDAGAVGINLEDGTGRRASPLLDGRDQAERIRAARAAAQGTGVELFINARTDVYLAAVGAPESRPDEVLRRAGFYLDAGADGIFVPGLSDGETIASLVDAIDAPLNIMAAPRGPAPAELGRLGVARVSLGPALALATFGLVRRLTRELIGSGAWAPPEETPAFADIDQLFASA